METPSADLLFAFVAAATGTTQPTAGAEKRRVLLGTATSVPVPERAEHRDFAALLAHLRAPPVEHPSQPQTPPDLVGGTQTIEATDNVSDLVRESIVTLPTQSYLATNELLPNTRMPTSGTLLPQAGNILPPVVSDTRAPDEAEDIRQTSRNQLPSAQVKTGPQPSPIEDGSKPDRPAVEIPLFLRSLTSLAITAPRVRVADASRPGVGPIESTVTQASILEQSISASTFESSPERNTIDLPSNALTKAQPSELGRADFFQPTPAPFASRAALTDSGLLQSLDLNLPSDKAHWAEPLAQRLAWLIHKGANTVDLRLHPPRLGRVEVRISVQSDQVSIWLSAANPEVREMLAQALPRLDGLLENSGLELADAGITEEGFDGFMDPNDHALTTGDDDSSEAVEPHTPGQKLVLGLIDTYV